MKLREEFKKTLDFENSIEEILQDSNSAYISWLEEQVVELRLEKEEE